MRAASPDQVRLQLGKRLSQLAEIGLLLCILVGRVHLLPAWLRLGGAELLSLCRRRSCEVQKEG